MELEKLTFKDCTTFDAKQVREVRAQLDRKLKDLKFDLVAEQKNGLTVKRSLKKAVARLETKRHSLLNAAASPVKVLPVKTTVKTTPKTKSQGKSK